MASTDWKTLMNWIRGEDAPVPKARLELWTHPTQKTRVTPIKTSIVGGNLTVLCTLLGTPFQKLHDQDFRNSFLFLEDVDEAFYRIDRMMQQLLMSGCLDHIHGIILGTFLGCRDSSPQVLSSPSSRTATKPLRKTLLPKQALRAIFREIGNRLQIPVVYHLPVGHGPRLAPLPLGQPLTLHV